MKRLALVSILSLAALIRLLPLPNLLVFTPDESYILYIAQTLVKDFHIIWIGVSALGLDFYMGPLWIYFIYPFVGLFKGDPLIIAILSCLAAVCTTYLLYWFGQKLFKAKVGLLAALMYAASPLLTFYDQRPYPPYVPLMSLLMAISLYQSQYSRWWWVVFAVLCALVFNLHLSLILVILVGGYWAITHRKSLNKKFLGLSLLSFTFTMAPLIGFDYFHKASNITTPIRILKSLGESGTSLDINHRINVLLSALSRIWYLQPYRNNSDEILYPCNTFTYTTTSPGNWIISSLVVMVALTFFIKKDIWEDERKRLLVLMSLAFLVPFLILPIFSPVEYYLLGFFPILFIILATSISSLTRPVRYIAYLSLIIFVIYSIFTVANANQDFGINHKKHLIARVAKVIGDQPYELDVVNSGCHGGWRYLFTTFFRKPERSSDDPYFAWLYPEEVTDIKHKYTVVIEETRLSTSSWEGKKIQIDQGAFSAYLYEQ